MTLNLLKLCVGADTVEDLEVWSRERLSAMRARGEEELLFHTTRMVPKRTVELLEGGALYWVIKGNVQARQRLIDIRPFTDKEGIRRCRLMLAPEIERTEWQPRRAFQGWRYLQAKDAPGLLGSGEAAIPARLKAELAELGLL